MRGILMFSETPDIVFIHTDQTLKQHINDKAVELGLLTEDEQTDSLDPNIVLQIFSPLVASQKFMVGHMSNPYQVIRGKNDLLFVFQEFAGMILMGINGDGGETEEVIRRKLMLLNRILAFLYGPVLEEIRPDRPGERDFRWGFVGSILETWSTFYNEEQSFLLEAVERLQVNQLLNAKCVELLEVTLTNMRLAGDKYVSHTLLVTQCKLLALFSSRKAMEIDTSDILLIILLVNTLFPASKSVDLPQLTTVIKHLKLHNTASRGPVRIGASFSAHQTEGAGVGGHSSEDTGGSSGIEYASSTSDQGHSSEFSHASHTSQRSRAQRKWDPTVSPYPSIYEEGVPKKPPGVTAEENHSIQPPVQSSSNVAASESTDHLHPNLPRTSNDDTPNDPETTKRGMITVASGENISSMLTTSSSCVAQLAEKTDNDRSNHVDGNSGQRTSSSGEDAGLDSEQGGATHEPSNAYHLRKFTVFLRTKRCQYTPHIIYCIPIIPGTSLVTISVLPKVSHAEVLTNCMAAVSNLLGQGKDRGTRTDGMEACLKKLTDIQKKFKGVVQVEKTMAEIMTTWDAAKKAGFSSFFPAHQTHHKHEHMPPKLESALGAIHDRLKELFHLLFITPRKFPQESRESMFDVLSHIHGKMRQELLDYRDYLSIKAQRNLTMTTYVEDFPGLVHFIYIDRITDQITVPSINTVTQLEEGSTDMTLMVKDEVWEMVQWFQQKLALGYTSMMVRKGDFCFSYFVWFEDAMGNPLAVDHPFRGMEQAVVPGILASNFYRMLIRDCFLAQNKRSVRCYELICVHLGLVPTQYVLSHCRKLAARLWETSSEAISPISLL